MPNAHIIYHANCSDGTMAAAVVSAAARRDGHDVTYHAAQYGNPAPELPSDAEVFIVDFSYPTTELAALADSVKHVVLLDHHKTAIDKLQDWQPRANVEMWLDDTMSGAMLAWKWFNGEAEAPLAVRWVQDRDLWQWQLPGSRSFSFGSRVLPTDDPQKWEQLLNSAVADEFCRIGGHISEYYDEAMAKELVNAVPISINGHHGLAVNTAPMFSSDIGGALAERTGTFGCVWRVGQDGRVHVSLRSRGEFNVRALAEAYGGGGHDRAAGCTVSLATVQEWLGGATPVKFEAVD